MVLCFLNGHGCCAGDVTVFVDGPTRVLRFASVQGCGAEEAERSILDLAARLRYKLETSSGVFT